MSSDENTGTDRARNRKKPWIKSWRDGSAAFQRLPFYVRAASREIATLADPDGCLGELGSDSPAALIARRAGATTGDRRKLRQDVPALIDHGFLELRSGSLYVANFERYQTANRAGELRDKPQPKQQPKPDHDANVTRTRRERDAKTELTARNDAKSLPEGEGEGELRIKLPTVTSEVGISEGQAPKPKKSKLHPELHELFEHWQRCTGSPRSRLDAKRKRLLSKALDAYGLADCKRVVDGAMLSAFHCGDNDNGKKYLNVELLFRDAEKVEQFLGYADNPPKKKRTYINEAEEEEASRQRLQHFRETGAWN